MFDTGQVGIVYRTALTTSGTLEGKEITLI